MKNGIINFFKRIRKKYKESTNTLKELYRASMRITWVVMLFMVMAEAFFLARTYVKPGAYREYLWHYRTLYISLIAVLFCGYIFLFYVKRNYDKRYVMLAFFNPVSSWILYVWAIGVTYLDMVRGRIVDPTLFMTIVLCVPLCLYINPITFMIGDALANILMLNIINWADKGSTYAAVSSHMNYTVFAIIQLVIGMAFLYTRYTLQDKILKSEAQQKENEELNKAQNRFFSSMSHEIRTPINTIIGLNEMTLREDTSDEVTDNSLNIQAASTFLLSLINEILDMSKLESGQMEVITNRYNTGDMLSEIVNLLWIRAKNKKLEFHIDVDPNLPSALNGDEVKIKQILVNVLTNAIKYTQEGSVTLSIQYEKKDANNVVVTYMITDTGMGIKKESLPYLFTAFKRVDEEKNRYIEGTGLGLSIVKQYLDLMHGTVKVNSIYGQGSTFVIEIPQTIESSEGVGELDFEIRHAKNNKNKYKQRFEAPEAKVLAVDDNEANLLVIEKYLKGTKVHLDTVTSGADALKNTMENAYDVIFMDHLMPEMDGIECLHKIREQTGGLSKNAKIIIFTANAGSENHELYDKEGFDGYLLKPVRGEELENELLRNLPSKTIRLLDVEDADIEKIVTEGRHGRNRVPVMITADSVCDLPADIIRNMGIAIMPYHIKTPSGIFLDGVEATSDDILSYMVSSGDLVSSDAPGVSEYEEFFKNQLTKANHIIHIALAKKTSNGYKMSMEASKSFDNVTVIDSGQLSSGTGLVVITAAQLAKHGASKDEIIRKINSSCSRTHTSFVVESTDFLSRSGRVSKVINKIANAFMIHPVIVLKNDGMRIGKIFFGTRERFWRKYINSALSVHEEIDTSRLFITYAGLSSKDLNKVAGEVVRKAMFEEVIYQKASPAISINCGPGTFGLLFQTKS